MVSVNSTHNSNNNLIRPQTEQTVGEGKTAPIVVPVGQTSEVEYVQSIEQQEVAHNSTGTIYGFSIIELKEILNHSDYSNKVNNKTEKELIAWVNQKIDDLKNNEYFKGVTKKFQSAEEIIIRDYINHGFDELYDNKLQSAFYNNDNTLKKDIKEDQILSRISLAAMLQYAARFGIEDLFEIDVYGENGNSKGLTDTLGLNKNSSENEIKSKLNEYLLNMKDKWSNQFDGQGATRELLRLFVIANDKERGIIRNFIEELFNENNEDFTEIRKSFEEYGGLGSIEDFREIFLNMPDYTLIELGLIKDIDLSNADKSLINRIADIDIAGTIPNVMEQYGIKKERYEEIINKIADNPDYINSTACTDNERKFILEILTTLEQAGAKINVAIGLSDRTDDEKSKKIQHNTGAFRDNLGDNAYREVLEKTYQYIEENKEKLNLPENFADLMNAATNDNYDIVVNDYINNTYTELNETVPTETGANNSDGVGYNNTATQEQVAQAQGNIQALQTQVAAQTETSNEEQTPVMVRETKGEAAGSAAPSAASTTITSNEQFRELVDNNSLNFVAEGILTGRITTILSEAINKSVNYYETIMDKARQMNVLKNAAGKFSEKLLSSSKESTLHAIANGIVKGKSHEQTKKYLEYAEETIDKNNALS